MAVDWEFILGTAFSIAVAGDDGFAGCDVEADMDQAGDTIGLEQGAELFGVEVGDGGLEFIDWKDVGFAFIDNFGFACWGIEKLEFFVLGEVFGEVPKDVGLVVDGDVGVVTVAAVKNPDGGFDVHGGHGAGDVTPCGFAIGGDDQGDLVFVVVLEFFVFGFCAIFDGLEIPVTFKELDIADLDANDCVVFGCGFQGCCGLGIDLGEAEGVFGLLVACFRGEIVFAEGEFRGIRGPGGESDLEGVTGGDGEVYVFDFLEMQGVDADDVAGFAKEDAAAGAAADGGGVLNEVAASLGGSGGIFAAEFIGIKIACGAGTDAGDEAFAQGVGET